VKKYNLIIGLFTLYIFSLCLGLKEVYAKSDLKPESGSLKCRVAGSLDSDRTSFDESDFDEGNKMRIEVRVQNVGSDKASPVDIDFYIDDKCVGRTWIKNLYYNTSKIVSIDWRPRGAGRYKIKVIVDIEDEVDEDNEKNNTLEKEIRIREGGFDKSTKTTGGTDFEGPTHTKREIHRKTIVGGDAPPPDDPYWRE